MGSPGGIVLSLFTVAAVIWGLALLGSEDATADELIQRMAVLGASVVALALVYVYWFAKIPKEWDADAHEEIVRLRARLEQKQVVFMWHARDNKLLQVLVSEDGNATKIGRVAVKNISHHDSIRDAHVSVVNYKTHNEETVTRVDQNLIAGTSCDSAFSIHATREETLDLFRIEQGSESLMLGPFRGNITWPISPGKYCIKLTASADSMPRVDSYAFLHFRDYDNIEYRQWREGDTSHGALPTPAEESRNRLP